MRNHPVVAFLLDNPVSDLSNPDCLDFHVDWNKNPKKDRSVSFVILRPYTKSRSPHPVHWPFSLKLKTNLDERFAMLFLPMTLAVFL